MNKYYMVRCAKDRNITGIAKQNALRLFLNKRMTFVFVLLSVCAIRKNAK